MGRDKVAAFIAGLAARNQVGEVSLIEANGEPALRMTMGGQPQPVAFDIRDGRMDGIFGVLNPRKLTHLGQN